jgi:hypothetical protein
VYSCRGSDCKELLACLCWRAVAQALDDPALVSDFGLIVVAHVRAAVIVPAWDSRSSGTCVMARATALRGSSRAVRRRSRRASVPAAAERGPAASRECADDRNWNAPAPIARHAHHAVTSSREGRSGAVRCSCSDQQPALSAARSVSFSTSASRAFRSAAPPSRNDRASRTVSRRSRPIRAKVFRGLLRAAAGEPLQACVSFLAGAELDPNVCRAK